MTTTDYALMQRGLWWVALLFLGIAAVGYLGPVVWALGAAIVRALGLVARRSRR